MINLNHQDANLPAIFSGNPYDKKNSTRHSNLCTSRNSSRTRINLCNHRSNNQRSICRCEKEPTSSSASSGQICRRFLTNTGRTKLNKYPDRQFYSFPRFVKHVDDNFINNLTELYRKKIPGGSEILDLMSSWVSHLPPEIQYKRVVGHGLNAQELSRNPRLDYFFVKDLNVDYSLEAADSSFDAVLIAVSVQYLEEPEKVFAEIFRVLRPGGVCIVSFSNRMFYEKAIAAWRDGSDYSRIQLVVQYFQSVPGFTEPEIIRNVQNKERRSVFYWILQAFGRGTSDPFYAVVSYRNFKPV